jgi:nucleoid DNA-binding protein
MHSLITSYLLQNKECILPGIGVLKIIHTPASIDTNSNRILPPFEGIIFKNTDHSNSPDLIKYIAGKKHVAISEAEMQLDNFCKEWIEKINAGGKLHFETVGTIQRNGDGELTFEKENSTNFFQPLPVENVYHKAEQSVVGVEETVISEPKVTPAVVTQEVIVERSYWGLWALIFLAVGFVMLFYHFKDHKLSGSNIGNQHRYVVDSAGPTYQVPK